MSLNYDYWINGVGTGLGFSKRISVDTPQERATAQFRKDQFDSQSTVGDQSLAGWWTRGQLSFHRGAGLKYYEVSDGETVLNRFRDGLGVDPFTQPGEVSLGVSLSSIYNSLPLVSAVAAPANASGSVLALTSGGALKLIDSAGSSSSIGSGYTIITSDGTYWYAVSGTTISTQGSNPRVVQANYLANPAPASSTGWTITPDAGTASIVTHASSRYTSRYVGEVNFSGLTSGGIEVKTTVTGLTSGHQYEFSIYLDCYSQEFNAGNAPTIFADSTTGPTLTDIAGIGGQRLSMTFTAASTSAVVGFTIPASELTSFSGSGLFEFSSAMVTDAPSVLTGYFDGSSPGWAWTGTTNNSKSTRSAGTSTSLVAMWSNAGASNWTGCWWAKGRMWAVDSAGRWFTMAPTGQSAVDNDTFWRSGITSSTDWQLSDSPGAVFISNGRDIYAATVVDDGLLPTIGAPSLVAQLPVGEDVMGIKFYLGQLIISTTAGLRLAVVGDDGTSLAYGPLIVEGVGQEGRIALRGNSAYVPMLVDGTLCIVEVSFSDQISDLVRPYSRLWEFAGDGTNPSGVFLADDMTLRAYDETGLYKEAGTSGSGWLETGFHRLGTLDPKAFRYLRVKTTGSDGSVSASVIKPDGTTTSVGTVAAGQSADLDLSSALADPVEYVGLRFTLTADGGVGPTLIGYQLKALPVPKRQRLIRTPLMLFDREVDGKTRTKRGRPGDAWTRLAALEALEESNAVVTYADSETGETGSGYIEAVEVKRTAPTSRQEDGFGGLLYVTIRKLG